MLRFDDVDKCPMGRSDALAAEEVRRRCRERWNSDNRAAIEHYNARIERDGLPLARYRSFMKGR